MGIKLAEALLRRKELADKIKAAGAIKAQPLFEKKVVRKNVTEQLDDFDITLPRLTLSQVTGELDYYAKQLRLIDAAIQQANWTTELPNISTDVMTDYAESDIGKANLAAISPPAQAKSK